MNLYKKCTSKPYYFLVIDATHASHNLLRFRKNLFERIWKTNHDNYDKIRDEKLHYDSSRKIAKTSVLSSGKIGKYEHLAGEKVLLFNQRQIIE